MPTVFMIRHIPTGKYSLGGMTPGFSDRGGRIWTSAGSFSGHLGMFKIEQLAQHYKDCEFLSFDLSQPTTQQDVNAFVRRAKLKDKLTAKHRDPTFAPFIDKLDRDNLAEKFQWVVLIDGYQDRDRKQEMAKEAIKRLKIKRDSYRTSGLTFAFANKMDAAKFRLSISGDTFSYDSTTLLAVD